MDETYEALERAVAEADVHVGTILNGRFRVTRNGKGLLGFLSKDRSYKLSFLPNGGKEKSVDIRVDKSAERGLIVSGGYQIDKEFRTLVSDYIEPSGYDVTYEIK